MTALSADAVWEILRWLDTGAKRRWRWLFLLFAERHALRRPLPHLTTSELFDRREDAFAMVSRAGPRYLAKVAVLEGHEEAVRRHVSSDIPRGKVIEVFQLSCDNGLLSLAKWLAAHVAMTREEALKSNSAAFRWACGQGHLELAKWLAKHFEMTSKEACAAYNFAFCYACWHGHLETAKWLATRFNLTRESAAPIANDMFFDCAETDHAAVIAWLQETWP